MPQTKTHVECHRYTGHHLSLDKAVPPLLLSFYLFYFKDGPSYVIMPLCSDYMCEIMFGNDICKGADNVCQYLGRRLYPRTFLVMYRLCTQGK